MPGPPPGEIGNLVAARSAYSGDFHVLGCVLQHGKEPLLPHCARYFKVLLLVAKATGHATAARRNFLGAKVGWHVEHGYGRGRARQGLLMAVAMHQNMADSRGKFQI